MGKANYQSLHNRNYTMTPLKNTPPPGVGPPKNSKNYFKRCSAHGWDSAQRIDVCGSHVIALTPIFYFTFSLYAVSYYDGIMSKKFSQYYKFMFIDVFAYFSDHKSARSDSGTTLQDRDKNMTSYFNAYYIIVKSNTSTYPTQCSASMSMWFASLGLGLPLTRLQWTILLPRLLELSKSLVLEAPRTLADSRWRLSPIWSPGNSVRSICHVTQSLLRTGWAPAENFPGRGKIFKMTSQCVWRPNLFLGNKETQPHFARHVTRRE